MTFYGLLWVAGGNDILAITFDLSINQITWFMRVAVFLGPVVAFVITKRWCISLQRHDNEQLLHGYETRRHHAFARGRLQRAAPADRRGPRLHPTARDRDRIASRTRGGRRQRRPGPGFADSQALRAKALGAACTPTTCRNRPARSSMRAHQPDELRR